MRVLHVYSGNLFGGIESILVAVARDRAASAEMTHEFALCFDGRLARELAAAGAMVHQLGAVRASRPHSIAAARRALAAVIASHEHDVAIFHAPWSFALFARVARKADVPVAFWAHDAWSGRHWTERWARRHNPDLVVANSRFTVSTMDAVFVDVPRAVVHPPVDVTPVLLSPAGRKAIRQALQTSSSDVVVVQASRMEAWKGHASLLRALADVRSRSAWVCWIVGGAQRPAERTYVTELDRLTRELGIADRVRFVGDRADVPRVLAAADIYCQANARPEPFGIAFVEALASGRPVVTVASGGATEIVDESCGRLVAANNVAALRDALRLLIDDGALRARLAAAAPARARRVSDAAEQTRTLERALSTISHHALAG